MKKNTIRMIEAALCLSLSMVLPLFTGQIPEIGRMLLPMHFPVLLCGLICGWRYGLAIGFFAPFLRAFIFGMPPLFPVGTAMAFELATYGFVAGLFYSNSKKSTSGIYISLILAMLLGRIVWGLVMAIIAGVSGVQFGIQLFVANALINAIPGLVFQLVAIPLIVIALNKSQLSTLD